MAAGSSGGQSLTETPTWAVAVVCFVMVLTSMFIEHIIHQTGKWLTKRNKRALREALEKIKSELMLLGFISLLLRAVQDPISDFCVPKSVGDTWHPCKNKLESGSEYSGKQNSSEENYGRRLLAISVNNDSDRVVVAVGAGFDKCAAKGKVNFVSAEGINQLHIFVFVLAAGHILNCIITLSLGRLQMRRWKAWEDETQTTEYQVSHDPERFRFARETSFGRRHLNFWASSSILLWIVCFFRQFFISTPKVDYLTLRHGFIIAHLAPQSQINFNFHEYIKRSLEEDFKSVVGISPIMWFFAIVFILFNTYGLYSYLWLPFIPLITIILVGTKLQVTVTSMALRIEERGKVVMGTPLVQPTDDLFWLSRPRLLLHLVHYVLFQNAFQLAFFVWTWYEFGLNSCFHEYPVDMIVRLTTGVLVQIICSYKTLPLYALVTQMGSTMRPTVFSQMVVKGLKTWRRAARKRIKHNQQSGIITQTTTLLNTPSRAVSPVHPLPNYRGGSDGVPAPSRLPGLDVEDGGATDSPSYVTFSQWLQTHSSSRSNNNVNNEMSLEFEEGDALQLTAIHISSDHVLDQREITLADFSFDNRARK